MVDSGDASAAGREIGKEDSNSALKESAIRSVLRSFQDFMPYAASQYATYENAFFKESTGIAFTAGLLFLPRGLRRFLFRQTLGRFQSKRAEFARAERNVNSFRISVGWMKRESEILLEEAASEVKDGICDLKLAGDQSKRLAKTVRKLQVQTAGLHTHKPLNGAKRFNLGGQMWIHSAPPYLNAIAKEVESGNHSGNSSPVDGTANAKPKRKKLKGKRAVVRWLKFFRWKKKKEYERMTPEEKILYKLRKARQKEERLVTALKKIEPTESAETTHDPEILTPEEHFFFLKMGLKCKNYVPVGRRGIYQGVILNMHLHWKKHQTLKVVVKTFSAEEVKEIAAELARLTGGIVLDIHEEDTIIMYRGKNYSQPPTEIMSPRVTLPRKKALDKSKYRDGLRAVRKYIPKLQQDLELLRARAGEIDDVSGKQNTSTIDNVESGNLALECSDKLKEILERRKELSDGETSSESDFAATDSEDLSDIFETDSETESKPEEKEHLYLDQFEKFPVESDGEPEEEDFEEHLRQISNSRASKNDVESPNFDEVDQIFLQAASLLRKKKK